MPEIYRGRAGVICKNVYSSSAAHLDARWMESARGRLIDRAISKLLVPDGGGRLEPNAAAVGAWVNEI